LYDSVLKNKYGLTEGGKISNENDFSYSMNAQKAEEIKNDTMVMEIYKNIEQANFRDDQLFTGDTIHKWNKHNFGYIYLPKKSDVLKIDTATIFVYKKLIETESRLKISIKNDSVFLADQFLPTYTVKENYYFVMGDNRDNAIDSRYIGLVAEKNIIGRIIKKIYPQRRK
jgi:signal peptidase I